MKKGNKELLKIEENRKEEKNRKKKRQFIMKERKL